MLDRYWHGATSRISPEAPVPVVNVRDIEDRPGGAANVAINAAALGVKVGLMGVVGNDEAADALGIALKRLGVHEALSRVAGINTITKLRVISQHQQLIRLDFDTSLAKIDQQAFLGAYVSSLAEADAVVLSDYNKGTLSHVGELIGAARKAGLPVLVDPKGNDFEKYRGATLLTPNLSEFTAVVGPCETDYELNTKAEQLRDALELEAMLVTLSERGMLLVEKGKPPLHIPARAREVYDVTGAGDTVIATLAASYAAGSSLVASALLANIAAGVVVGKLGTGSVTQHELRRASRELEMTSSSILTQHDLKQVVEEAKAHGEKIVMTNGCFDILHEGHVKYLQAARRLGHRLIVAVNDDGSVRRLKGDGRPVNAVEQRMAVLAGLASVDWVVSFDEDTPERLICEIKPDVLVKGGDYKPEEIAGHNCVVENGGEVRVLDYIEGVSTTNIINAITNRAE